MAIIKTTAKRNPITGDAVPVPAYARGRQTNFAGTDRKRTPDSDGFYNAGERNAKMKSDKALVKQLDDSFRSSEKSKKTEARTKQKEENKAYRSKKQDANQLKRDIKASKRGGGLRELFTKKDKANYSGDKSKRQRSNAPGQKSQDRDCKIKMRK